MRRLVLTLLVLAGAFTLGSVGARAAVLAPAPINATIATGEVVRIPLVLDSEGESVNALEVTLTYQPEMIDVMSIDTGLSAFPLWVEAPSVNAQSGRIHLVAGVPRGTVAKGAEVVSLIVRAKLTGATVIGFEPSATSLLLNDGAGSRATTTLKPLTLTITHPDPDAPTLRSPSHPQEGRWSSVRDAVIEWMPYKDLFVSYRLSTNPLDTPDEITEANTGQIVFPALTDGVWYFSFRSRLAGKEWSPVARYQLLIDGTAPAFQELGVLQESSTGHWLLTALGADTTAGVARTEARFETVVHPWWAVRRTGDWQDISSPADLGPVLPTGRVLVRLTDAAGNMHQATVALGTTGAVQLRWLGVTLGVVLLLLLSLMHQHQRKQTRRPRR